MDNLNSKQNPNTNSMPRPKFLTSENPDVLKNIDLRNDNLIKPSLQQTATQPAVEESSFIVPDDQDGYISPYQVNPQNRNISSQPDYAPQQPTQMSQNPGSFVFDKPQGQNSNNVQNQNPYPPQPIQTQNPLENPKEVIYKKGDSGSKGGGIPFVGSFFRQLLSFIGCLLFLLLAIIIGVIYVINV
jgi:hypothetical protein